MELGPWSWRECSSWSSPVARPASPLPPPHQEGGQTPVSLAPQLLVSELQLVPAADPPVSS